MKQYREEQQQIDKAIRQLETGLLSVPDCLDIITAIIACFIRDHSLSIDDRIVTEHRLYLYAFKRLASVIKSLDRG